jgi:hypothetical protein
MAAEHSRVYDPPVPGFSDQVASGKREAHARFDGPSIFIVTGGSVYLGKMTEG